MRRIYKQTAILILLLIAANLTLAKGHPSKITISGADLDSPIEITDSEVLHKLAMLSLEESLLPESETPEITGEGYEIMRFYVQANGTFTPFDRVHYYPMPDGSAYIFYDGLVNGWSEYDGKWFRASKSGHETLQSILNHEPYLEQPQARDRFPNINFLLDPTQWRLNPDS